MHSISAAGDYNMAINAANMKTTTITKDALQIEVCAKRLGQFVYLGRRMTKDMDCFKSRLVTVCGQIGQSVEEQVNQQQY